MVKTRIICTLGPSTNAQSVIGKMMRFGMDVVRCNFSHGNHKEHAKRFLMVKKLNKKYRRSIKILYDLEGYRIRIGKLKPFMLKKRQVYYLIQANLSKNKKSIPFDYKGSLAGIERGQFIYIDDGKIILKVLKKQKKVLKVEVVIGGRLCAFKGINIPGFKIGFSGLTAKDKKDLEFAFRYKPDFIAQSFVRNQKDVQVLRQFIKNKLPDCKMIAKIENQEGIRNIDTIIKASDVIMIARGDMGVSIPIYKVPFIQKKIIEKCKKMKKKAIVATQMLESMTENFIPSRAEVSDVANAILDGADFVMLSAETATGKYPTETVKVMNDIIKFTENIKLQNRI